MPTSGGFTNFGWIPGPPGPQGPRGPQGPAGIGINILGSVANYAALLALPGPHDQGDAWIVDSPDGDLYVFHEHPAPGNWVNVGRIVGPQGLEGPPGPTGPQGPPGKDADSYLWKQDVDADCHRLLEVREITGCLGMLEINGHVGINTLPTLFHTVTVAGSIDIVGLGPHYYVNGVPIGMGNPAGANRQIQWNNNGAFGASADLRWQNNDSLWISTDYGGGPQTQVAQYGVDRIYFSFSGSGFASGFGITGYGTISLRSYDSAITIDVITNCDISCQKFSLASASSTEIRTAGCSICNIGSSLTPAYQLDVAGDVNITDPLGAGGFAYRINGVPIGSPAGANTEIQYNNNGAFGASPNLTFDTPWWGAQLTVGSAATPTPVLQINASQADGECGIVANGKMRLQGVGDTALECIPPGAGAPSFIELLAGPATIRFSVGLAVPAMFVDPNGHVGIGTQDPRVLLDTGTNLAPIKIATYADSLSSYGIGEQIIAGQGALTFGANIDPINGVPQMFLLSDGVLNLRPLNSAAAPALSMAFDIAGHGSINTYGTGAILSPLFIDGNPLLLNRVPGSNVGIGTLTPTNALDVTGNIACTGDMYTRGDLYGIGGGARFGDSALTSYAQVAFLLDTGAWILQQSGSGTGLAGVFSIISPIGYVLNISPQGNINIGWVTQAPNPAYTLDINGPLHVYGTTGSLFYVQGVGWGDCTVESTTMGACWHYRTDSCHFTLAAGGSGMGDVAGQFYLRNGTTTATLLTVTSDGHTTINADGPGTGPGRNALVLHGAYGGGLTLWDWDGDWQASLYTEVLSPITQDSVNLIFAFGQGPGVGGGVDQTLIITRNNANGEKYFEIPWIEMTQPPAGSHRLWADPADGYTVKWTP